MPLPILLALVIGGISAIALLLHLSGRSALRVIGRDEAQALWRRHYPDDGVHGVTLAQNGHAALVETDQGPGLLWSFGDDTVARHLRNYDLTETGTGIDIAFHDYTAPHARLRLEQGERTSWLTHLAPMETPA